MQNDINTLPGYNASEKFLQYLGSHELNVLKPVTYHGISYVILNITKPKLFIAHKGVSKKLKRRLVYLEQIGLIRYEPNKDRIFKQ